MPKLSCISGFLSPGMVTFVVTVFIVRAAGQPLLQPSAVRDGATLNMSVSGTGLPPAKRMTLTFVYDPLILDLPNAVVSSPLPSAAFGALLDTAARELILNIVGTSVVTVADDEVITEIRVPVSGDGAVLGSLTLIGAALVDADGNAIEPEIAGLPVVRPPQDRRPAGGSGHAPGTPMVTLDGRICGVKAAAVGLLGGRVVLAPVRRER